MRGGRRRLHRRADEQATIILIIIAGLSESSVDESISGTALQQGNLLVAPAAHDFRRIKSTRSTDSIFGAHIHENDAVFKRLDELFNRSDLTCAHSIPYFRMNYYDASVL